MGWAHVPDLANFPEFQCRSIFHPLFSHISRLTRRVVGSMAESWTRRFLPEFLGPIASVASFASITVIKTMNSTNWCA